MNSNQHQKFLGFAGMVLGLLAALWPWFFAGDLMKTLETITGVLIIVDGFFIFMPAVK